MQRKFKRLNMVVAWIEVTLLRSPDLIGVINGIDSNEWNPSIDPLIIENFSLKDLSGKSNVNKTFNRYMV